MGHNLGPTRGNYVYVFELFLSEKCPLMQRLMESDGFEPSTFEVTSQGELLMDEQRLDEVVTTFRQLS